MYLLWSVQFKMTYVGQTKGVENRLERHNAGFVRSTKAHRPWIIIHQEQYSTRSEAMKRERWLKSPSGRKWIEAFIDKLGETGLSVPLLKTTERDRDSAKAESD